MCTSLLLLSLLKGELNSKNWVCSLHQQASPLLFFLCLYFFFFILRPTPYRHSGLGQNDVSLVRQAPQNTYIASPRRLQDRGGQSGQRVRLAHHLELAAWTRRSSQLKMTKIDTWDSWLCHLKSRLQWGNAGLTLQVCNLKINQQYR